MNPIKGLQNRLSTASDLTSVLMAAYETFDTILVGIRASEDPATGMFAALVMSAASAADGRDAIARAPSLPLPALSRAVVSRPAGQPGPGLRELATALAGLAAVMADRLAQAELIAVEANDQAACAEAAGCAREIHDLLAGASDER